MNSKGTRAPGNHPSDATEPGLERRPHTRQPLLWAALAYAIGIVAGSHAWRPPLWLLIAIIGFSVFELIFFAVARAPPLLLGLAALFVAGALAIQIRPSNTSDTGVLSSRMAAICSSPLTSPRKEISGKRLQTRRSKG